MATSNAYSGALSLNTIHMEVGEGSTGTTCSIGDADIRNRMGYGSIATSFYGFYKSWGTSITHGTKSIGSSKLTAAQSSYGFSANPQLFSVTAHGSVSDASITSGTDVNGTAGTIWLDAFRYEVYPDLNTTYNSLKLHVSTNATHTGLVGLLATTDPFRANKINRVCWNDAARPVVNTGTTSTNTPSTNVCYWQTTVMPGSGTYDVGIRWANGA
jgi:hypothetical protein